ncbi:MAG TPA: hypothetical protein VM492_18915 [Sumerlaeia bacterium]|nr:hypothetical protein [Sumerlaeia bacterium]
MNEEFHTSWNGGLNGDANHLDVRRETAQAIARELLNQFQPPDPELLLR